jgi:hypothetical protein
MDDDMTSASSISEHGTADNINASATFPSVQVVVQDVGGERVGVFSCDVRLERFMPSLKTAVEDYVGIPAAFQELLIAGDAPPPPLIAVLLVVLSPPQYFTTSRLWELPGRQLRALWTPVDYDGVHEDADSRRMEWDWFEIRGDPYTGRLSYAEPREEGGWLHGWVETAGLCEGRMLWTADLVRLEDDEEPWYGPAWGPEPRKGARAGRVALTMVCPFASSRLIEATRCHRSAHPRVETRDTRKYRGRAAPPLLPASVGHGRDVACAACSPDATPTRRKRASAGVWWPSICLKRRATSQRAQKLGTEETARRATTLT